MPAPYRTAATVLVLAVLVLVPSTAMAQERETAAPADSIAARLDSRLPALLDTAEIPGMSVALVRGGQVVWTGVYGVRNTETEAPVTEETVFQAASLSKPVFAYVVMRLVERGVLELDRPLHQYLANPRMADDRYPAITARMVLSHSTGLPNWGGDSLRVAFDPGTGFRYSGEGYVYLQQVVETLTGEPLHELARREVLDPLGMDRSSYVWLDEFESDFAVGHDPLGRPGPPRRYEEPNAAYSLLTTAGDYARFVAAVLEGRGLEPESWRAMTAPVLTAAKPTTPDSVDRHIAWALGWGVHRAGSGAAGGEPPSLWHWGDNGPFRAFVALYPGDGLGLVYFANSIHGLAVARELIRTVTGGRHWGPEWAGYEAYDDPVRIARRQVYHAFADSGIDRGAARLTVFRVRHPELFDPGFAVDVAALLDEGGDTDEAIAVLETARSAFPDSTRVLEAMARTQIQAGRYEAAMSTLRGLARWAEGGRAELYRSQVEWVQLRARARREPVEVPIDRLRQLAGDYGPRHITLEGDTLYYQRDGNPRYRLVPLGDDLFQPVGTELFRIRFVGPQDGVPEKIVGLYFDGSSDETHRTTGG